MSRSLPRGLLVGLLCVGVSVFLRCEYGQVVSAQVSSVGTVKASPPTFVDLLANRRCRQTLSLFAKIPPRKGSRLLRQRMNMEVASQLAMCGHWHMLFASFLPLTRQQGRDILNTLESSGLPVEDAFFRWLRRRRYWQIAEQRPSLSYWQEHQLDAISAREILSWLAQKKQPRRFCPQMMKLSLTSTSRVRRQVLRFVVEVKCPHLLQLVRRQLSHNNIDNRIQACSLLGKLGNEHDVVYLQKMVVHDRAYVQRGTKLSFPVKRVCRDAFLALKKRLRD